MMSRATVIGIGENCGTCFPTALALVEHRPISRAVLLSSPATESTYIWPAARVPMI